MGAHPVSGAVVDRTHLQIDRLDGAERPFAIMGGLTIATALTLLFLPAAYAAWFRITKPAAA